MNKRGSSVMVDSVVVMLIIIYLHRLGCEDYQPCFCSLDVAVVGKSVLEPSLSE